MKRNQKGFTLMELMVVIVIVAILAAVAVPLYINYVKDASRTEAKGAIGAIITAEQTYNQQFPQTGYFAFADGDIAGWATETNPANRLNCDITEARVNWEFECTTDPTSGFTVIAKGKTGRPTDLLKVTYQLRGDPTWAEE